MPDTPDVDALVRDLAIVRGACTDADMKEAAAAKMDYRSAGAHRRRNALARIEATLADLARKASVPSPTAQEERLQQLLDDLRECAEGESPWFEIDSVSAAGLNRFIEQQQAALDAANRERERAERIAEVLRREHEAVKAARYTGGPLEWTNVRLAHDEAEKVLSPS